MSSNMFSNNPITQKKLTHLGREYSLNYIGISDVTHKAICEGDIVSYLVGFSDIPEQQERMTGVVVYFPLSAAFGLLSIKGYLNGANPASEGVIGDLFAFSSTLSEFRVLGNVFENEELLTVEEE